MFQVFKTQTWPDARAAKMGLDESHALPPYQPQVKNLTVL